MHYYSYNVKMQDLRGGFPGFLSKSKPVIVDGTAHMLVADETKYPEERVKKEIQLNRCEIVKSDISRPFTDEEYKLLPQQFKDALQKGGYCMQAIPFFSASIKPFSANS